ncbi:MAG: sigma-70 family RNA polymerase sigma factor [Acidobacteria bacterium]|nr:sigma-70 family RNA polymerase sigma factor [Acidobacteriota bacterium]
MCPQEETLRDEDVERLLDLLKPQMKRILFRYQIPFEDAEDLLQQTLVTLLYKRKDIEKPEPWILATLKNRCIMYWRRQRSQLHDAVDTTILELFADPGRPKQERMELGHDLARAIERLPERCQNILRLRYGLDLKPAEVAEALGYQKSSIRKITNRCLEALSRQLVVSGFSRPPSKRR